MPQPGIATRRAGDRPVPALCLGCGRCVGACPQGAHGRGQDGAPRFERARCTACGRCAEACPSRALELVGREATAGEVLAEAEKDRAFYEESGGGLTLSGGEPLAQPAFAAAVLRAARSVGLHTCLETCGAAPWPALAAAVAHTDLVLYDVKDTDPERHLADTGAELAPILANLRRLDAAGARVELRCPLVPGLNVDERHLEEIAVLASGLRCVTGVTLLPYHPLGRSKAGLFGLEDRLAQVPVPGPEEVARWRAFVAARTVVRVQEA